MKATEAKLLAFLQKSPQFVIPIYQRTNSWTDSFTRHFYKLQPLRTLEQISADILAIEKEAEGLPIEIVGGANDHR